VAVLDLLIMKKIHLNQIILGFKIIDLKAVLIPVVDQVVKMINVLDKWEIETLLIGHQIEIQLNQEQTSGMTHGRDHVKLRKLIAAIEEIDLIVTAHRILIQDHVREADQDHQIRAEVHIHIVQDLQGIFP
jgi:hypothetical protein